MTPTLGDAPPPHESPLEPRFFARVVAELPVAVIVPSGPVRGVACDLSEGGIGVALDAPMVVGTLVELVVWLHGSSAPPIRPICHVAWNRHEEGKARVGFELYEISDDDAAALRDYLAQHEAAQVTEHESEPGDSTLPPSVARQYVPLVRSIALGLCRKLPSSIQVDDLIGAGFVGLVEAYRRHDASDETGFKVYAERRILGAMLDELRSLDPLSRGLRDLVRRANTTAAELTHGLGRAPTRAEVAERLGVATEILDDAVFASVASSSVKSLESDGAEQTSMDVPDALTLAPDDILERAESLASIRVALQALPPRLRQVLELYYGESVTLRDIGSVLGVTESRVSQIRREAVSRMQGSVLAAASAPRKSREVPLRFRHDPERGTRAEQARRVAPVAGRDD